MKKNETTKYRPGYWIGRDDDKERPYVVRNVDGPTLFRFATFAEAQKHIDAEVCGYSAPGASLGALFDN